MTVVDSSRAIVNDTWTTGLQDAPVCVCVCICVHMYIYNRYVYKCINLHVCICIYIYVVYRRSAVLTVLPMRMKHKKVMGMDRKERVNEGAKVKLYQITSQTRAPAAFRYPMNWHSILNAYH